MTTSGTRSNAFAIPSSPLNALKVRNSVRSSSAMAAFRSWSSSITKAIGLPSGPLSVGSSSAIVLSLEAGLAAAIGFTGVATTSRPTFKGSSR